MSDTTAGIDKLIARIRTDAVDQGKAERDAILEQAKTDAATIVANARAEGEDIVTHAQTEAVKTRKQLDTELKMAARDFVTGLSQRLRAEVIEPAISAEVSEKLKDSAVLSEVIAAAVTALAQGKAADVVVDDSQLALLSGAAWKRIEAAAKAEIKLSGTGTKSDPSAGGFRLKLRDQHVVWDFSDAAVAAELALYVAPRLRSHFSLNAVAKA